MTHVEITIRFPLATAFHTTGNRRRLWADKALALSTEGTPILPATTIKGYLRERAEVLLRTWGQRVCLPPVPTAMCSEKELCLACQVFGNPRHPSPLRFQDGQFVQNPDTMVRSGVSISRSRRAALPQRLFSLEATDPQPGEVVAIIEGDFADPELSRQATALIVLAARSGFAIGAGRTRGLGWLERDKMQIEARIGDQTVENTLIEQYAHLWSGGKHVVENQT
jgi:CRISPR/Cas system CSM-associated protein Csm3 (group 7 of RAMP superfamily)